MGQFFSESKPEISPPSQYEKSAPAQQYYREPSYNQRPPAQILSHKQSQNHDGVFKYTFQAENGLAQGETIAPDGTRNGGYTYVDPSGKKILVKYSAGKEGFRILESTDHIPKAITAPFQSQQQYSQPDYSQYRIPAPTHEAQPPPYTPAKYQPQDTSSNSVEPKEREYDDEPGKPYSFGKGYHFEFNG